MAQSVFFSDAIRPLLLREISKAQTSIHVAAAWFTDYGLFEALLERQHCGVSVTVVINDDEINDDAGLPFHELVEAGGQFQAIADTLMHHKFCVIDGQHVITGSYNWTRSAATKNQENILLLTNTPDLAQQFIEELLALTGQDTDDLTAANVDRILRRLRSTLGSIVELESVADFQRQAARLQVAADSNPRLLKLAKSLRKQRYSRALQQVEELTTTVNRKSQSMDLHPLQSDRRELALRWVELGLHALDKRQTRQADKCFTKAIAIDPKIPEAYAYRARGRAESNWPSPTDPGLLDCERAFALDPNCVAAFISRGILYTSQWLSPSQAMQDFNRAITLDPRNAEAYEWRGLLKLDAELKIGDVVLQKGDIEGAIADFDLAIRYAPNNYQAYRLRGDAKEKLGNQVGAEADFTKAAELKGQAKQQPS